MDNIVLTKHCALSVFVFFIICNKSLHNAVLGYFKSIHLSLAEI